MGEIDKVHAFLLGQGALDGKWFGEKHQTERGNFWWRKHLRAAILSAPSPEWVKTSERLPDFPDWDEDGYLWGGEPGRAVLIHYADAPLYPYWMPKPRAQPPEPPEGER